MSTNAIRHNVHITKRCIDSLAEQGIDIHAVTIPQSLARKPVITIDGRQGLSARFLRGVPYKRFHHGGHTTETHAADYQHCQIEWQTHNGA